MTYDQVLVFHKIVELGSFKSAALALHRTQPAVSFAIKKLEEELSVELFDRSSYRPSLTCYGHTFFEHSQKIMQGMSELEELSKSFIQKEEAQIKFAIEGISPLPDLLKVFKDFQANYPHTRLHLSLEILSEAERKVLDREVEIGITHFVSRHDELEIIPITEVRLVPVISTSLYREKGIKKQSDLAVIDQVVVADRVGPSGVSFGLLENGRKWRIHDSKFKKDIIQSGLGWGHLPYHEVSREIEEGILKVLDFEDIHERVLDIKLIRLKRNQLGLVGKAIWDRLKALRDQ